MNKTPIKRIIIYVFLGITSILVVLLFVTAKTYTQLGLAVVLYPILAFLIIKAVPRKTRKVLSNVITTQPATEPPAQLNENGEVIDIDKRTFLKLVGATGVFFFISSLLGKWLGTLPFNESPSLGDAGSKDVEASQEISSGGFSTTGYTITEIDEGIVSYYGFTNKDGNWLIMKEDSDTSSFRYAKGDINFPKNWGNREHLTYDYYYNIQ